MTSDASPHSDFPAHWRRLDARSMHSFDWAAEGVDLPYVFLITGRCGSTHLASLLSGSGTCGQPSEYFNPGWMPDFPEARMANSLAEYLLYLVRGRSGNRRFGFKIDHWRWKALGAQLDVERLFPVAKSVFFLMTRQDIVAQAHSFAVARATSIWHEHAHTLSAKPRDHIPADAEILREMSLIAQCETLLARYLKRFGRPAMRLTYEELMQDPKSLLRRIGEKLALEPASLDKLAAAVSGVRKHEYPRREEQIERLKARLAPELAFLDSCRENFRYKAFNGLVRELRGIALGPQPAETIEAASD